MNLACHVRIESRFCRAPPSQQTAVPRNDEWTRFVRTLAEINENRDDAEELAAQRLAAWAQRCWTQRLRDQFDVRSALMEGRDVLTCLKEIISERSIDFWCPTFFLRHLPCQLAGTSPVFLRHQGYQTSDTNIKPYLQKKKGFLFYSTRCLNVTLPYLQHDSLNVLVFFQAKYLHHCTNF